MIDEDEPRPKKRLLQASKPTIRRWVAFKMRKSGYELGRAVVRQKLRWTERKSTAALEQAFDTFKTFAIKTEHGRLQSSHLLNKMGLYLLIAARDIQAAKRDALTHPDEWTRRLHARLILLTIIEWNMDAVAGQKLKAALDTMKIQDELQREMAAALRRLRKIKERVGKDYTFVRNVAIAHRDPDVLAQYRAIRDLDTDKLYEITAEFFRAVEQFVAAHIKLMHASSSIASVLAQWTEHEKNGGG